MTFNGILGFIMMITVLFCIGDLQTVLETDTGFPFIQVFYDSVGSVAGATVMGAIVLVLTWACAIGITTTASRMTWSFARDRGTPFSRILKKVDKRTQVPIISVCVVCFLSALLTLIYIGSPTAFNDVISLTITGFYGSYFLPAAFLLYHRVKGHVSSKNPALSTPTNEETAFPATGKKEESGIDPETEKVAADRDLSADANVENAGDPITAIASVALAWGPFRIPGIFGIINNIYACLYMIFVIFWSVWPPVTPVDAMTMNYSVVVTGGVILFSVIWYWVRGRKEYQGPTIDEEVRSVLRIGSVAPVADL
jgi:choline transport protein